jgi:hypothetical protein
MSNSTALEIRVAALENAVEQSHERIGRPKICCAGRGIGRTASRLAGVTNELTATQGGAELR